MTCLITKYMAAKTPIKEKIKVKTLELLANFLSKKIPKYTNKQITAIIWKAIPVNFI